MGSVKALAGTVLFKPVQVGPSLLQHRIVMSPMTRFRANDEHVLTDLAVEYYKQRSSTPGTLIITEATFIAQRAGGLANGAGLWSKEQVAAWKKITDVVHANGSFIRAQLYALGRTALPDVLRAEDPSLPYISSSATPLTTRSESPRPLTIEEIKEYVQLYIQAAKNAIEAGFDGVEIHGANGYLIDQFIKDVVNKRTDDYGGSIENRARFPLEIIEGVVKAVGEDRTAIRFSPWGTNLEMRIEDPVPQFSYLLEKIREAYPKFSYVHFVEPDHGRTGSNDVFRKIWAPRPFLSASHTAERPSGWAAESSINPATTIEAVLKAAEKGDIIALGRYFLANPDLPLRLKSGIPLNPPDINTFYAKKISKGYIDYPFAEDVKA
ncbi:hypothetical protein M422DRAFT_206127 [Sphaerobolus stellatus SS14]|uniref:NADH:flavin oxidoreductase/NADH oxidase N-terminal domain-containing protein n=1 Tax=Sphaerobolus stellatus (strain SS14) TaxID=990650 RepID=A0A0C9VHS2_SPHS4|nr:hypothetical protein M422DRAFT_206127 [Sphaerobolus stellatus SS14]